MTPVIPDQGLALFRDRARMQHFLNFLPRVIAILYIEARDRRPAHR
jgi:hypothetical protein